MVDEDYRGAVGVVLFNHGATDFQGTNCPATEHAALQSPPTRSHPQMCYVYNMHPMHCMHE